MTDRQTRIADDGSVEDQPVTWDGEPVYSVETVAEGLFSTEAFEQMPGQTAMPDGYDPWGSGELSSAAVFGWATR